MKQRRFGLIGHPIAHSLSPALFRAGYDGRYHYDLIEGNDFEESYQKFLNGYDGINVTAPFKELAFAKADILSEECRLIKATNLLIKTPEGIKAHNSDYLGVRMWLSEIMQTYPSGLSQSSPEAETGQTALIVGCGGAGKAAAIAAASLGFRVILMNRDASKAYDIAANIRSVQSFNEVHVCPLADFTTYFREADMIIYNIPTAISSLNELTEDDFRGKTDNAETPQKKHILEANYKNPSFDNTLIDRMKKHNPFITYTKGEKWLLYQALTGYEIFTGETPDLDTMRGVI